MNLTKILSTYEYAGQLEMQVDRIDKTTLNALRERETLKEQLRDTIQEITAREKENRRLEEELVRETQKLEKLAEEIRASDITLQLLTEQENKCSQLESDTRNIEDKTAELEAQFSEITALLAAPERIDRYLQLIDIENRMTKQTARQKRLKKRQKDQKKNKKNTTTDMEKKLAAIEKIKKQYGKDIDQFVVSQEEYPKKEKIHTALRKKAEGLAGKITRLKKKINSETNDEIIKQYRQELEKSKKELEGAQDERVKTEKRNQEINRLYRQEKQRLEKLKDDIKVLEAMNDELARNLNGRGIAAPNVDGPDDDKTTETIEYLKKYCSETVLSQDRRAGRTGTTAQQMQPAQ